MAEFEITAQAAHDPDERYGEDLPEDKPENPLDTPEARERHKKLLQWRDEAFFAHSDNRYEQAVDEDFYDGLQITEEERQVLEARGQAPLVFNEIKPAVDWVLGTERRSRVDWKVHPRTEDDVESAQNKTKLLKYVSDVNRASFHRSLAFQDAVKTGVGWLEDGIRSTFGEEPLYSRHESWRNIWLDPLSTEPDISDARYLVRKKWVDLDVAKAMFPDRVAELEAAQVGLGLFSEYDDEFNDIALYYRTDAQGRPVGHRTVVDDAMVNVHERRARVKLYEHWYKVPMRCKAVRICHTVPFSNMTAGALELIQGQPYDEQDELMKWALDMGYISLAEGWMMEVRVAIYTDANMLMDMASPYRHRRFPFTPIWAYRRARDNAPYGSIRNSRDPQSDLNKRRSKALHILSTNQVIMEDGAVEDEDEMRDEVAAPDGVVKVRRDKRFEIRNDKALAEEHLMLERSDAEYIRHVSGVTGENQGMETNATSGKAIQARQLQGGVITTTLFDNLRLAVQLQGEIQLSLIEQYYDEPKIVRLVGDRGSYEFLTVNKRVENAGIHGIENPITLSKADFIVDAQDFRETMRLAMLEQMMEMVGKLPGPVAIQLLDLVFDMSDVPGKDEWVKRIRQINGHADPEDSDNPEAEDRRNAQNAIAQKDMALSFDERAAAIQDKLASARKKNADADDKKLGIYETAMKLAEEAALKPDLLPIANAMLDMVNQYEVSQDGTG